MSVLRALIVDDERLARNELRRLLGRHPEIEIVGEAANAGEARRGIADLEPELLFLDVQMPGETGFDLLASLDAVPVVVFTTAYDEHALRAFEVNALDYLVKPIDPKRLATAVARLLAQRSTTERPSERPLAAHQRVFVSEGERCWLVPVTDIELLESVDDFTRVHFGDARPLVGRSLSKLEARLDGRLFFRANRTQLVNVEKIRALHAWFGGRLLAELAGGERVTISRRRARAFRELMGL